MKTPRRLAALALALCLSVASPTFAAGATATADPGHSDAAAPPGPGGPVSGKVFTHRVYTMGWCAVECFYYDEFGKDSAGNRLSQPDYYPITTADGAFTVSSDAVAAGSYRIAFYGLTERNLAKRGYLQLSSNGIYRVTRSFAAATPFTVQEAQALDLGTLDLIVFSSKIRVIHNPWLVDSGGLASNNVRLIHIPQGAKVVFRSYGCGGLQTTKTTTRAGSYTYNWTDPKAYRHYGRNLRVQATLVQGSKVKRFSSRSWQVTKFGWRCRR